MWSSHVFGHLFGRRHVGAEAVSSITRFGVALLLIVGATIQVAAESTGTVLVTGRLDGSVRIDDLVLDGADVRAALLLEPFQVFANDAEIVLHGEDGDRLLEVPNNAYLRGSIEGRSGSQVLLSVLVTGLVRGVATHEGRYWMLSGSANPGPERWRLVSRKVDSVAELDHDAVGFDCRSDALRSSSQRTAETEEDVKGSARRPATAYTARIAVETDNEFFNKFGSANDAVDYVADIIAFGSIIYSAEVNTSWFLSYLSLWTTGYPDPWSQSSPDCGLYEFGRYWNNNRGGVSRTITHFMSGKSTNAGIAWVGVLCSGSFVVNLGSVCPGLSPRIDTYGGGYGYTGGIDGNFDIDNPSVVWDIFAVTHEIGHNFNSPHTHCYADLGGSPDPIDRCYSGECGRTGCNCLSSSLPSGCPGSGFGCGTIMSYCHLLSGGSGNISLTLGQGHPYGIAPGRVPSRMATHVAARAVSSPGCLEPVFSDLILEDGFDAGNLDAWSHHLPE